MPAMSSCGNSLMFGNMLSIRRKWSFLTRHPTPIEIKEPPLEVFLECMAMVTRLTTVQILSVELSALALAAAARRAARGRTVIGLSALELYINHHIVVLLHRTYLTFPPAGSNNSATL